MREIIDEKRAEQGDEMMDRQVSQTASDLPIPECRFILNAVNTAGPSLKNRQTQVRR